MGSVHDDEYQGKELVYPLAAAVFRAALHALPASARAWFGDLRDRGLAASVEVTLLHGHGIDAHDLFAQSTVHDP